MTDKEKIRAYIIARMDDEQEAVEEFDRLGAKESAGVQRSLLGNNAGIVSFIDSMQENPAWSEEDLDSITAAINNLEYLKNNYVYHQMGLEPAITFLKSLKYRVLPQPQQEWSEEDEKEVAVLEAYIRSNDWSARHVERALGIVDELVNKVKSLRPQSHWKPSDEQMAQLQKYCPDNRPLTSLYEQLKKLREK